jgi:uncharacterized protein YaaW (UPF0174 family)
MSDLGNLSDLLLTELLTRAEPEERQALSQILYRNECRKIEPKELQRGIRAFAGHPVGNFFRGGQGVSYSEILHDAAKHLKVEPLSSRYAHLHSGLCLAELDRLSSTNAKLLNEDARFDVVNTYIDDLERKILAKLMVVAYEKATPEQRAIVDAKVADLAKSSEGKSLSGLSTSAALIVVGNLGGFATYTLMSTVLSAVSMGTLGFGAYTLASSLLSVVLGPAGWLSLAAYGIYKYGSADAGKLLQLAATCAMISQRLREKNR